MAVKKKSNRNEIFYQVFLINCLVISFYGPPIIQPIYLLWQLCRRENRLNPKVVGSNSSLYWAQPIKMNEFNEKAHDLK